MEQIKWSDFEKIELRVGTVISAIDNDSAYKASYILEVDFGEEIGVKKSSAQITELYQMDDLIGKQVVGIVNFPPKQIGKMISECLITGFSADHGEVALCIPDQQVPNGARLC